VTLSEPPTTVALFSKHHPDAKAILRRITGCLDHRGIEIVCDPTTAEILGCSGACARPEATRRAGMVVSVGGDGTLLATARTVGPYRVPILGINLGSLGFLTETHAEEVEDVLTAALDGEAPVDERQALGVRRGDAQAEEPEHIALNDVVISNADLARLFSLSLLVDGDWVADYRADGLILATPTGSTAYNLAAGGPLILPNVDALVATPICPHSLSQRPLIFPGDARLTIVLPDGQRAANVQVTVDGQVGFRLTPGDRITIGRASHPILLVRPPGRSFFSVLRDKLSWGKL
jgi:NAD+ kinase